MELRSMEGLTIEVLGFAAVAAKLLRASILNSVEILPQFCSFASLYEKQNSRIAITSLVELFQNQVTSYFTDKRLVIKGLCICVSSTFGPPNQCILAQNPRNPRAKARDSWQNKGQRIVSYWIHCVSAIRDGVVGKIHIDQALEKLITKEGAERELFP